MTQATLQGIDQDGESRLTVLTVPEPASTFLTALCACGWKYARLERDGVLIGEVVFSPALLHRQPRSADLGSGGRI